MGSIVPNSSINNLGISTTFIPDGNPLYNALDQIKNIGLDIRCSLHVGEIVWRNDDITGIAVNIASRILDLCESGNVVISKNLRDLLGRSEFAIEEIGDYSLKGVEGDWKLFKVT